MSSTTRNPDEGDFVLLTNEEHYELLRIIKSLSLCLDEYGAHQGTHYIRDGKIEPKGSFIELVERARRVLEENDNG